MVKKLKPAPAGHEVDEQLARYRAMRDFSTTAEPSGGTGADWVPAGGLPFVIQKHAATRLHYDFRLGWRGVLKSWACAKGPSYNTHDKRLAVQVEDHPLEYGGFEGTIPKGQYGGGTVLLWDQGTWEPLPGTDFDEGLRKGSLKFTLHGHKLEGRWTLVRMGGRAASESKPNWLLIKEHDGRERNEESTPAIIDSAPESVVTGRDLAAIAEAEDHVWNSHPAENGKAPANHSRLAQKLKDAHLHGTTPVSASSVTTPEVKEEQPAPLKKQAARRTVESKAPTGKSIPTAKAAGASVEAMPAFIPPQLASVSDSVPPGTGWLHELKLDGYRIQAHLTVGAGGKRQVTLFTRSGLDWTHRMPPIAKALEAVAVEQAVLDGELVVLDGEGKSSFSKLQGAFEKGELQAFTYFVFDLLHLDGYNLRGLPLEARKTLLQPLAEAVASPQIQFSQHLAIDAKEVLAHACGLGVEGILAKQGSAPYSSGRSDTWLKLKCTHRQEFVVAGFTLPKDGGSGLGSLLLGYYHEGALVYCGRCGTGFSQASARAVRKQLEPLRQAKSPYAAPLSREVKKNAIWVRPKLVCETRFATWTEDGLLRHASFQGMRTDKPAAQVVKETGTPLNADGVEDEAPATSSKPAERRVRVSNAGKIARLTHPDKVLDPAGGTTKQQLSDYLAAVAPVMLPHIAGRPVSIVRCPNGTGKPCFFQKHVAAGLPASLGSVAVPDHDDPGHSEPYITVDSAEALAALAQLGVLELHPWGSKADTLEQPDQLILDLDPDTTVPWATLVESALTIRAFLKDLQLETWVKTTGGKGLHIIAPLEPSAEWPEFRLFARGIAAAIESSAPKLYLIKMTKAARKGRIFLDWMRNERGSTAVAPWSPRARAGMRVAMPMDWDELGSGPPAFAVANFSEWRNRITRDPWAAMRPQRLQPEVLQAVLAQSE